MCTDSHVIVCYPQKEPVLAAVNEDNFVSVVSDLCNGFEIVYAKKLWDLHEAAVLVCCDDFYRLKAPICNDLATYFYNADQVAICGHWKIVGTVCIAKCFINQYGEHDLCGFSQQEAQELCKQLNDILIEIRRNRRYHENHQFRHE